MRPSLLDPLFASLTSLPGIGAKTGELYARLLGRETLEDCRVVDLVFHAPSALIDRRNQPGIALAPNGAIVTVTGRIDRHQPPPRGSPNVPYRVFIDDDTGELTLVFFRAKGNWLEKSLPVGETVMVSGKIDWFNGRPTMVHPDHVARISEGQSLPLVEPVYPLTAGLSLKMLQKVIASAVERVPDLPEWLDDALLRQQGFPTTADALRQLHQPRDQADIEPQAPARRRLAYDEFLAGQLSLALVRARLRKLPGVPVHPTGELSDLVTAALPFSLTSSQQQAVRDILEDMAGTDRMLRLLQGDVGAGKTIVALLAMLATVESGGQAVLMAPTEILARQHLATITQMLKPTEVSVVVLTGRAKGREREDILERIASGEAQIIIGTHALFQDNVAYHNLALAVVDEQHRFGVHQRLRLTAKGISPHMLVMTATPIPRTLVLAAFGDMDVSRLTEKPAGRKPIHTVIMPGERIGEIVDRLKVAVAAGRKVYWICPLVEESEEMPLMSVEERHAMLAEVFGSEAALIHGRMSGPEIGRAHV
jgi:ATP-dependent DNA helicase RecG